MTESIPPMGQPSRHMRNFFTIVGMFAVCMPLLNCFWVSAANRNWFPTPEANAVWITPAPAISTPDATLEPATSPGSQRLLFVGNTGDNVDIYSQHIGRDEQPVRLTVHTTDDTSPALSPNGKHIAWVAQADDVKGDIWIMKSDGSHAHRLTDRSTTDDAPAWSPDNRHIYFTTHAQSDDAPRIDRVDVHAGDRHTIIARGWDPALSPDGQLLVYASTDARGELPHVFATHLPTGRRMPLTDGRTLDGFPRIYAGNSPDTWTVVFTRYADDDDRDGQRGTRDTPSLWALQVPKNLFDHAIALSPYPLTSSEHTALFPAHVAGWLLYTSDPLGDLDIFTLPLSGMINPAVDPSTLLRAAAAEDNLAKQRMLLRYVLGTQPTRAGEARYALAGVLAQQQRLDDALTLLQRVVDHPQTQTELRGLSQVEIERLQIIRVLNTARVATDTPQRVQIEKHMQAIHRIATQYPSLHAVQVRKSTSIAEAEYALGHYAEAMAMCHAVARVVPLPHEDGARCVDLRGAAYSALRDDAGAGQACAELQRRYPHARVSIGRCVQRWMDHTKTDAGLSPQAALEQIVSTYADLPFTASHAAMALADTLLATDQHASAADVWRYVINQYPQQRSQVAQALWLLGDYGVKIRNAAIAMPAFEQLLREFTDFPTHRDHARRGLITISLAHAEQFIVQGDLTAAKAAYERLLLSQPDVVIAHKRLIAISAQLNESAARVTEYRQLSSRHPRNPIYHFAYAYALTYQSPLPWRKAYAHIQTCLTLDPRFAAAHITRSWLALHKEHRSPNHGWLETAVESLDTAQDLIDPERDHDLQAAIDVNRGNAFAGLGKMNAAFDAYLARAMRDAPFDDRRTEMLFYESFARVAWAQDHVDVALDMAHAAYRLARPYPPSRGYPASVPRITALLASLYWYANMPEAADPLYRAAIAHYRDHKDWVHAIPMLRDHALVLERLQRYDAALAALQDLVILLNHGKGTGQPKPPSLSWIYNQEDPVDPKDVTRAIYGFSTQQEADIAHGQIATLLEQHDDTTLAKRFADERLRLLQQAARHSTVNARIQPELLRAWHASALLDARTQNIEDAQKKWHRALQIIRGQKDWAHATPVLHALSHLWLAYPQQQSVDVVHTAEEVAGLAVADKYVDPFARWLALHQLMIALRPPADLSPAPLTSDRAITHRLQHLQQHLDTAMVPLAIAYQYAGMVPHEANMLATPDASADPPPSDNAHVQSLITQGQTQAAWQWLEQQQLQRLHIPEQRVQAMHRIPTPALQRAIDHQPIDLPALQAMLTANHGVLVQAFALSDAIWHWFVISENAFYHVTTSAPISGLPSAVHDALTQVHTQPDAPLYAAIDVDHLANDDHLFALSLPNARIVHVLSATYAVAAYEARNLGQADSAPLHLAMPSHADLDPWDPDHDQITFAPHEATEGSLRTANQILLRRIDLNDIASITEQYDRVIIDHPPAQLRAQHALHQALLLAGIPTILFSDPKRPSHPRVFGDQGMSQAQQVQFAANQIWQRVGQGVQTIKDARADATQSASRYQQAVAIFVDILHAIAFLQQPARTPWLAASSDAKLTRLTPVVLTALEASSREQLAEAYSFLQQMNDAIAEYRRMILVHSQTNNHKGLAAAYFSLGNALARSQQHTHAIAALSQCIPAAEAANDALTQARCTSARASSYRSIYAYPRALADYQHAIALYQPLNHPELVNVRRFVGFLYESSFNDYAAAHQAFTEALNNAQHLQQTALVPRIMLDISRVARQEGEYARAIQFGEHAEQLLQDGSPTDRADVDLELAKIAWYQGNYPQARKRQQSALERAREARDRFREIQAISLLGLIDLNQGDLSAAEIAMRDALHLSEVINMPSETATQLNNLGIVVREAGRYQEALGYFQRAQQIDNAQGSLEGQAYDARNLGITYHRLNNITAAEQSLTSALAQSRTLGNRYNELQTLIAMGDVRASLGKYTDAEAQYDAAKTLANTLHIKEATWRALYGLGRMALAQQQRSRARQYFDAAITITHQLQHHASVGTSSTTPDALISDAIAAAIDDHAMADVFRYMTQGRHAAQIHPSRAFPSPTLSMLQHVLPKDMAALLYFVGPQHSFGMLIQSDHAYAFTVRGASSDVLKTTHVLHDRMRAFAPVDDLVAQLSGMLIAPIPADAWRNTAWRHLVLLPDPALRSVPFAALQVGAPQRGDLSDAKSNNVPQPLLTRYAIAQAPSAAYLMYRLQQPAAERPRSFATWQDASSLDLPFAALEIRAIASDHPATQQWPMSRQLFTERPMPSVDALDLVFHHDAAHGTQPLREQLLRHAPPAFVALSACDTALADAQPLADAFLYAGSTAVVATLGRVSDLATATTMKRFFRQLPSSSAAEALQHASLTTRRYFSHPAHWAWVTLVGDPR